MSRTRSKSITIRTEGLSLSARATKYVSIQPAQDLKNGKKRKTFHEADDGPAPPKKARTTLSNSIPLLKASHAPSTLFVHGSGGSGQLGLGPNVLDEIGRPRLNHLFTKGIQCLAAGGMHSLLIDAKGQLWSWGSNDDLALGRQTDNVPGVDSDELESTPAPVEGLESDFIAVAAAAGDCMSVVIASQGQLRIWGTFRAEDGHTTFDGDPCHPPKIIQPQSYSIFARHRICQVVCGASHVLALTTEGYVFTWGFGERYELGRVQSHVQTSLTPEKLALRRIVLVGAGGHQSFAVDSDGVVYAWGLNHMHQLGLNRDEASILFPSAIGSLHPRHHGGASVVSIACGEFHTLFLFNNGELWGCGRCDEDALGLSPDHPAMVQVLQKHTEELPGIRERLAKKYGCTTSDPELINLKIDLHIREPVRIAFPPPPTPADPMPALPPYYQGSSTRITSVAAGPRYSLACAEDGSLYAWGVGTAAQLGLGPSVESVATPTRVRSKMMNDYVVREVDAGGQHAIISATKRDMGVELDGRAE